MPEAPRTRVWRGRQALAAAGVIAVMVVWRAVLLGDSYFNQDDFYLVARAARSDLTFGFLFEPFAGHVIPAQQLNFWVVSRVAPFDWAIVAIEVLLLQTAATVVMWHLLTRILPGRWARVPLLAVFAWSPLTLMTTLWWSAAIALWPHTLCSLLAALFVARAHDRAGPRWLNYVGCLLALAMGLAWHERAVLIVPFTFGLAVALQHRTRGPRRVWLTLREHAPLWGAMVVAVGGFLIFHRSVASVEGGADSYAEAARTMWEYVSRSVVPGLASGPWAATLKGGAVVPDLWVTIVSAVLALAVAVVALRFGGPSRWWAAALLLGYVLVDGALLVLGRAGFGWIIALDPRYASDIVHVAVPALALALVGAPARRRAPSPRHQQARTRPPRRHAMLAGTLTLLYLVGAAFGSAVLVPHFQNTQDRAYVANLRGDLAADPNQVIVDDRVPAELVLPLVGDDAFLAQIFAVLPESPVFDEPSARLRVVGPDGRLRPVQIAGGIPMLPGPVETCGYPVRSSPRTIPLAIGIRGRLVVRLEVFTDSETTATISTQGWSQRFLVRAGPNEISLVVPDMDSEVDAFTMSVSGQDTLCVAALLAGLPEAAPAS
jgi:hypothetical protein